MAGPTRDEFLSHVHRELAHPGIRTDPDVDPKKGSPTKSTQPYRWRELLSWDMEAEARAYWDTLHEDDKTAVLPVAGYLGITQLQLDSYFQQLTSERGLRIPFGTAFQIPHNLAIRGAGDDHAEMWTEGAEPDPQPLANADFISPIWNHCHFQCLRIHETTKWRDSLHFTHHPDHVDHPYNPKTSLFLLPLMRPRSRTSS